MNDAVHRYHERRDKRLGKVAERDIVGEYRKRRQRRLDARNFDSNISKLYGIAIGMGINGAAEMSPPELVKALRGEGVNIQNALRSGGNKKGSMKPDSRGYVGGWKPPKVNGMSHGEVNKTLSTCNHIGQGHYGKANKVANADNRPFLWTFTTHGRDHVQQVIDKTNQAADEIEKMPNDSIFGGVKLDRKLMLVSAWFHDTGMDGDDIDWGNDDGDGIRSAHGTQSAIHILEHAKEIEKLGVDPNKAAFIAFAHTKSKSGINDLKNPEDWKKGLDTLEAAAKEAGIKFDRKVVFDGEEPNGDNIHHMMAQVAALRLGDANREAKGNELLSQSGGKYNIDRMPDKEKCTSWEDEVANSEISITDKDGRYVLSDDDPKMSKVKGWRHSARVVLGERNMDVVDSRYNERHQCLQEDISLVDGNAVPWSTTEALLERVGELNTINGVPKEIVVYMNGVRSPADLTENASKAYREMWQTMKRKRDKYGRVDAFVLVFGDGNTKIKFGGNNERNLREVEP